MKKLTKEQKEMKATLDKYREKAKYIGEKLNLKPMGYDPGISFYSKEHRQVFEVPKWLWERLHVALGGKR